MKSRPMLLFNRFSDIETGDKQKKESGSLTANETDLLGS